jgi:hypothetical protein
LCELGRTVQLDRIDGAATKDNGIGCEKLKKSCCPARLSCAICKALIGLD